jgi:hypothetical protein
MTSDHLRDRVLEFEEIVENAKKDLWATEPKEVAEHFLAHDPVLKWRLIDVLDAYVEAGVYPLDRLPGVMDRLIDTKLQLYFVTQVFPGSMNALVYNRGFDQADPLAKPGLQLTRLSLLQGGIGQIRVLLERVMRLVYYLETGKDIQGKSIRKRFFADLPSWTPRWDVLAELGDEIDSYDSKYRTPEYHKGSVLKRELLGGDGVDANDVLGLITPVTNGVWEVLNANVSAKPHNILRLGRRIRPGISSGP